MSISDPQLKEIAELIISAVGLPESIMDELSNESKLSEAPFALDSIDILEIVATVEDQFKIQVVDAKEGAEHFQSLQSISQFINSKK